ncbi:MAG: hypothetical protein MHPSP_002994, partial [Paramarteilia canceri]
MLLLFLASLALTSHSIDLSNDEKNEIKEICQDEKLFRIKMKIEEIEEVPKASFNLA